MVAFAYYPEENLSSIEKALKQIENFFSRVEEKDHLFSGITSAESKSKIIIAEQQMDELQDTLNSLKKVHKDKQLQLQTIFKQELLEAEKTKKELIDFWEANPDTEQTALCKGFATLSKANRIIAACSENLHHLEIIHVIEQNDFDNPQIHELVEEWNLWCQTYIMSTLQEVSDIINYNHMLLTSIEDSYSTKSIG